MTAVLDPRTAHLPLPASADVESASAGRHRRRRAIRPLLLGYAAPVAITVAVTSSWFRFGGFIAGGDVAPFVRTNLTAELTSSWSHQLTGAGSASAPMTQALEVVLLRGAALFGLSPVWAQAALFGLCFGLAAFGAAFFAGVWTRQPLGRAGAGLLGAFNTYLLVNQPNVLPALAIGLIGVSAGAVLRAARTRKSLPYGAVATILATSLLSSYLALNPPLLAMAVVSVFATAAVARLLVEGGSSVRALRAVGVVGAAAVAVNLWWIVPLAQSLTTRSGATFSAQTNVSAWAWTQANSSLGAVAQLNGHWGWTDPDYYPYAHAMGGGWSALSWLPALLALVGVVAGGRDRLKARMTLGATTLLLLFLAKGVHAPFGAVNLWLFVHVPGMWLFRDPMSKFGALLVLLYAALAAMAVHRLARLFGRRSAPAVPTDGPRVRRVVHVSPATAAAVVLAALAVAYPWPLWSGAVIPASRGALPGEHVQVPTSWYRAAAAINSSSTQGKVLVLPLDPYYQVTTSWGYHGVDAIPAQLLKRPVVQQLPGGYFSGTSGFDALVRGVQASLLAGNGDIARNQLAALGVGLVVVRHDLRRSADLPPTADPAALETALRTTRNVAPAGQFGVADVFAVAPGAAGAARSSLVELHATNPGDVAAAIGAMPADAAATTDSETAVEAASWQLSSSNPETTLRLATSGNYRVSSAPRADTPYAPRLIETGSGSRLVLSDAAVASIDGKPLAHRPDVVLPLGGGTVTALTVNGTPLSYQAEQPVPLAPGDAVAALALAPAPRPLLGAFSGVGDCNRRVPGSTAGVSTKKAGGGVELVAAADTACTFAPVALSVDAGMYRVRLAYRSVAGNQARICLWEDGPNHCAQLPALASGNGWQTYTGFTHVDAGTTGLSLYLYADADTADGVTTTIDYKAVTVDPLRVIGSAHVPTAATPTTDLALTAGAHRVSFEAPAAAPAPRFSALQDCDNHGLAAAGALSVRYQPNGAVRLQASADAACVSAAVATAPLARAYDVSVEYRTDSGRPARICVWQRGPDRCADLPALDEAPGWHTLNATFSPAPGSTALSVYLYADGQQTPSTSVEYRNLKVLADTSLTVNVTQLAAATGSRVTAQWTGGGSAYTAKVSGAAGRFVLVLPESFSPSWRLTGLPAGWTSRHVEVDGYANGWAISGHGAAVLRAAYSAHRWSAGALAVSIGCALALLASPSVLLSRRRRGRR